MVKTRTGKVITTNMVLESFKKLEAQGLPTPEECSIRHEVEQSTKVEVLIDLLLEKKVFTVEEYRKRFNEHIKFMNESFDKILPEISKALKAKGLIQDKEDQGIGDYVG